MTILIIKLCIFIALGVAYSFGVISLTDGSILWPMLSLGIGSLIGIGLSCKIAMNGDSLSIFAKPMVTLWAGITLCYIILAPIGLMNLIKLIILGSVSFLFMTISNCYRGKNLTILLCTAVTGSGMMMDGIGAYAGGFPSIFRVTHLNITDLNGVTLGYLGYVSGWIIVALFGICS